MSTPDGNTENEENEMTFLNLNPETTAQAIPTVVMLTKACEATLGRLQSERDSKRCNALIAVFNEKNEVRVRIIERFGLQEFAAGLVG